MGCDIHWVIETRESDGRYYGVFSTCLTPGLADSNGDYYRHRPYPRWKSRFYDFFARIAGVRGPGPAPNGFPDDASDLARFAFRRWGADAHSPGHMTLREFVRQRNLAEALISEQETNESMKLMLLKGEQVGEKEWKKFLSMNYYEPEDGAKLRIIFWFDN